MLVRSPVKLLAPLALVAGASACDLSKGGSDAAAPSLLAPETIVTESAVADQKATFKYRSTVDGSTFKCATLVDGAAAAEADGWQDCPAEGVEIPVVAAKKYTFKVKAVARGVEDPTPAEVQFTAEGVTGGSNGGAAQPTLDVVGAKQLEDARSGKVELLFHSPSFTAYLCELDGQVLACGDGRVVVDLDTLVEGSHRLSLAAVDGQGRSRATVINFCARSCDTAGPSALANELQLGDFYTFKVEPGEHVTEYSTTKTVGVLSFFRVLPKSDPYYLGNYKCDKDWDQVVSSRTAAGQNLEYCHSTPTRAAYKDTHEYRLANNHVEVATDADKVSSDKHERISVSIYDADWEFMTTRSRFKNLCGKEAPKSQRIPMVNDFFLGRLPEEVTFWYCDAIIPARNGKSELWKVGAFIDIDALDWACNDCMYDRAVEIVYMARPGDRTWRDDYFVQSAQASILKHLTKLTP